MSHYDLGVMTTIQPAVEPDGTTRAIAPAAYRIAWVTDQDALDGLMLEYYGVIVGKLIAVGDPEPTLYRRPTCTRRTI